MANDEVEDLLPVPTEADRVRLDAVWAGLSYPAQQGLQLPETTPQNRMDLWAIEHQVRANRLSTASLARASRALVWVTAVLALVTAGQVLIAVLDHIKR